jgi:putative transposase
MGEYFGIPRPVCTNRVAVPTCTRMANNRMALHGGVGGSGFFGPPRARVLRHNPAPGPGGRAVKRKRFSVEQITSVLQQVAGGMPVGDVCRQVGISEQTFYRWKKDYGGMLPSEARELKQLRDENGKLKRLVADLSLDKVMLQDVVQKSSKARQAAGCRALLDGALRHQPTASRAGRPVLPFESALRKPAGPLDRAAAARAGTGADARAVWLSPLARPDAPGRLGGRQAPLLSPVHRGRAGAATQAALAACQRGPSRATTACGGPQ